MHFLIREVKLVFTELEKCLFSLVGFKDLRIKNEFLIFNSSKRKMLTLWIIFSSEAIPRINNFCWLRVIVLKILYIFQHIPITIALSITNYIIRNKIKI